VLETLQNITPEYKERVLSRVALSLMPNPGIEPEQTTAAHEELIYRDVLREIQHWDPKKTNQLFGMLSKEISSAALSDVNQNDVKARLGHKGLLSSSYYKIELSQSFRKATIPFGIRPSHVERAVRSPDAVEHLLPSEFDQPIDQSAFSLFLKTPEAQDQRNAYSLLIISKRENAVQKVARAWQVFHSDVDLSGTHGPLDVWRAFAEKYGFLIKVGDISGKFIIYKKMPFHGNQINVVKALVGNQRRFIHTFLMRTGNGFLEIAYAFMLDVDKYISDLHEHGINVDPDKFPRSGSVRLN